jgi:uncharacterized membrane protein
MANRPMQNPERSTDRLVRALGLASAGLGVPMLLRTESVARFAGVENGASGLTAVKATGARELAHAALLLLGPPGTVWTRVAGDAVDLTLLGRAISARKGKRRQRTTTAALAVGGIAAVDLYAALRTVNQQHGRGRPGPLQLQATVTVNKSPDEVYAFWRDFTNLPTFMLHLTSVTPLGDDGRRTRWEANAPLRRSVTWEAELTSEEPGRRIAWKSLPGSTIDNAGTVHFAPAPGDRGTEVKVVLHYSVPGGRLGQAVAKLLGEEPEQQVRDDLRRFKQVMETGDVVRSEGLPQGTDARHQVAQGSNQAQKHDKARKRG